MRWGLLFAASVLFRCYMFTVNVDVASACYMVMLHSFPLDVDAGSGFVYQVIGIVFHLYPHTMVALH